MRAIVSGMVMGVVNKVLKSNGNGRPDRPYRSVQLAQKTRSGKAFMINSMVFDDAVKLEEGKEVTLTGSVAVAKFADGNVLQILKVYPK